jgi:hypothetical protein
LGWFKTGESFGKEREIEENETKNFFWRRIGRGRGTCGKKL